MSKSNALKELSWDYGRTLPPDLWHLAFGRVQLVTGKWQSPIAIGDFPNMTACKLGRIDPSGYKAVVPQEAVEDHHVEIDPKNGGQLQIGKRRFRLKQFHIHTPAEHLLYGNRFPMEIHLVHRPVAGRSAVVAIFVAASGLPNRFIRDLYQHLPGARSSRTKRPTSRPTIDPKHAFPDDRSYFYYQGSLTTPPCTESLDFFVLKNPITASDKEIDAFRAFFPAGNNRPVQDRNDRPLQSFDEN